MVCACARCSRRVPLLATPSCVTGRAGFSLQDLPLTYRFGYYLDDGEETLLVLNGEEANVLQDVLLPVGTGDLSLVGIVGYISDVYGAEARSTVGVDRETNVTVSSLAPTGDITEFLNNNLDSLVTDALAQGRVGAVVGNIGSIALVRSRAWPKGCWRHALTPVLSPHPPCQPPCCERPPAVGTHASYPLPMPLAPVYPFRCLAAAHQLLSMACMDPSARSQRARLPVVVAPAPGHGCARPLKMAARSVTCWALLWRSSPVTTCLAMAFRMGASGSGVTGTNVARCVRVGNARP